jgi:hypothetical protein
MIMTITTITTIMLLIERNMLIPQLVINTPQMINMISLKSLPTNSLHPAPMAQTTPRRTNIISRTMT